MKTIIPELVETSVSNDLVNATLWGWWDRFTDHWHVFEGGRRIVRVEDLQTSDGAFELFDDMRGQRMVFDRTSRLLVEAR